MDIIKRVILAVLGIVPNTIIWLWHQVPERISNKAWQLWYDLPAVVRLRISKAVTDFWTAVLLAVPTLTVTVPDGGGWRNWLIALGIGIGNIILNAARRAWYQV